MVRNALAFLGRHAPKTYAASIFLGLALPWLAAAFRPLLPFTITLLIALAFARADLGGVRRGFARPLQLSAAFLYSTLAMPVLMLAVVTVIGRDALDPGLLLGLALIAAAPPLMASPVYAALLGFENSLILTLLVAGMAVTPLIAPPLAGLVAGAAVPIDAAALSLRLVVMLGSAALLAVLIRRVVGAARLAAVKLELDGFNVLMFFVFAVAAMDGVLALTLADPGRTALYVAASFAVTAAGLCLTLVALRWLGPAAAFTVALGVALRNTGLLVAPMGQAIPADAYLFFSILQFPIYMAPLLIEPLARMVLGRADTRVAPPPPQ